MDFSLHRFEPCILPIQRDIPPKFHQDFRSVRLEDVSAAVVRTDSHLLSQVVQNLSSSSFPSSPALSSTIHRASLCISGSIANNRSSE
ncbi:hypothetical protein Hypma_013421 [Hypsizygus marmoreus]|uniref:Uncharacterized protein n=1 Tax=Hypsizygus marmoreus TaxID=39966 RepID=A0A369JG31_HYPMA|nr:hypothetical protein Hypma_013421 [Hypsizygus marmoreus]